MSFYDGPSWQGPGRQANTNWDQPPTPSRSATSPAAPRDEANAFMGQFEEVERAIDNLGKGGKVFPMMAGRRESLPMAGMGRGGFNEFQDPRIGGLGRPHSMEFDPMRPHQSSAQNFYANQRYQPRHNDTDQMQQAKRRMAAQRERELRNYHQEQQYNRSVMAEISSQGKSERPNSPNSPNAMNEDDRRDLIARQRRALYGNETYYEGNKFDEDGQAPRPVNQSAQPSSARGHSPMMFNNFGSTDVGAANGNDEANKTGPSPKPNGLRSRSNSNSSPASAHNGQNFSMFDQSTNPQPSARTSTSSPGGSPPRQGKGPAPAPIGTRPTNPALNKRGTPPAASPLSFGFASNDTSKQGDRVGSSASNPPSSSKENSNAGVNWGSGSGVWGQGKLGGVQASVWG